MVSKNYYEILGVTVDSDMAEIKAAYRKLARKYHPDINNTSDAIVKFKKITEAYETLSDNVKRNQYNTLHGFFRSYKSSTASSQFEKVNKESKFEDRTVKKSFDFENKNTTGASNSEKKSSLHTDDNVSRKTNIADDKASEKTQKSTKTVFSDIFDEFAKSGTNRQTSKKEPQNGSDIITDVAVTLVESVKGTSKVVNIMHTQQCPKCRGRKFINATKCSECNGTGEVSELRKITVKIPANVKNGAKLRIPNEGNSGINGGKNGNLYLKISIIQGSRMKYDGADILYTVPITPVEAVLGASISVPSLDGNISLKIPPCTNSGQKFRLAEQGLLKNGKKGDMIVTVSIEIPDTLSDDEVRLYEKLKKLSSSNIREKLLYE